MRAAKASAAVPFAEAEELERFRMALNDC